jgi:hypothetical protein
MFVAGLGAPVGPDAQPGQVSRRPGWLSRQVWLPMSYASND